MSRVWETAGLTDSLRIPPDGQEAAGLLMEGRTTTILTWKPLRQWQLPLIPTDDSWKAADKPCVLSHSCEAADLLMKGRTTTILTWMPWWRQWHWPTAACPRSRLTTAGKLPTNSVSQLWSCRSSYGGPDDHHPHLNALDRQLSSIPPEDSWKAAGKLCLTAVKLPIFLWVAGYPPSSAPCRWGRRLNGGHAWNYKITTQKAICETDTRAPRWGHLRNGHSLASSKRYMEAMLEVASETAQK